MLNSVLLAYHFCKIFSERSRKLINDWQNYWQWLERSPLPPGVVRVSVVTDAGSLCGNYTNRLMSGYHIKLTQSQSGILIFPWSGPALASHICWRPENIAWASEMYSVLFLDCFEENILFVIPIEGRDSTNIFVLESIQVYIYTFSLFLASIFFVEM